MGLFDNANPKMITLGREYRGLSQSELAKELGVTQGYLSKVEQGLIAVGDSVIDKFAKALGFPTEFFLRPGDVFPPNLYYRKRAKTTTKTLTKAEAEMNIHRLNLQSLLQSVDLDIKPLPNMLVEELGSPQIIARQLRQFWGIPSGPILNLVDLVEKHGVIVVMCNFESTDIDGRSMYTNSRQPIIFLNTNLPADRQRFTLAHELGHLIMHMSSLAPEGTEKEADAFASEFLIPEKELRKQIPIRLTISALADLKRYWKVSMQAILYSAHENKIITPNNHKDLILQISKSGMRTKEPIELEPQREKPVILPTLIKMHLKDLEFSEAELATIMGLKIDEMKHKYYEKDERTDKLRVVIWCITFFIILGVLLNFSSTTTKTLQA